MILKYNIKPRSSAGMSPAELKKLRAQQRKARKAEERKLEEKRKEEKKVEQKKKQAGQVRNSNKSIKDICVLN